MHILFLSASFPYPPQQGGALRTYGLIKGLADAGHKVSLLSFGESASDTPLHEMCETVTLVAPPIRSIRDRLHDLVLSSQPDIAQRLYSEHFWEALRGLISRQQFDLVQAEGIEVACYLPFIRAIMPHIRLCFDTFNAEAELQRSISAIDRKLPRRWPAAIYSWIQARRISQFEGNICRISDLVLAVSKEDAELLQSYRPVRPVQVVPNGLRVDSYNGPVTPLDLGQQALVFTGKMDYRPNVDAVLWFVEAIWPRVKATFPAARFYVVGQKPHTRLDPLRVLPDVVLTGWVEDVQPYLRGASLYVAPLRMGSGTRLKLLEAMASGIAVIATSVAASGMYPQPTHAMCIADDESAFGAAILDLLNQPNERSTLATQARKYVKEHYDWTVLIPRLLDAYRGLGFG
jgi:glycosyltransferase involved in cell wall biosynthesis